MKVNVQAGFLCGLLIVIGFAFYSSNLLTRNLDKYRNKLIKQCQVTADKKQLFENDYSLLTNKEFLTYLRQHWIIAPSNKPRSLAQYFRKDFSQVGQSWKVDHLLKHKKGGFFIECGASNGEQFSNTLYFEITKNWTGLLIEPNPYFFNQLLEKHRKAYSLNACLSISNTTGKAVFQLKGVFGSLLKSSQQQDETVKTTEVQCFPLLSILLALGNPVVDYFSLDVEGLELAILQTVPWDIVNIDVIGIEYRVIHPVSKTNLKDESLRKLKQLRDFFKSTGLYEDVGILPVSNYEAITEQKGLDVFFKKIQV